MTKPKPGDIVRATMIHGQSMQGLYEIREGGIPVVNGYQVRPETIEPVVDDEPGEDSGD